MVKQWLDTFNPVKNEVLYYGNGQPPNLEFDNTMLTPSESHKHLGVTLSNNCKWTIHINNIILSATKLLGIIRKIKYTIRGRAFNQIYISFIRPRLEYASSVWYNCNQLEQNIIIVDAVHHYINAQSVSKTITPLQSFTATISLSLTLSSSSQSIFLSCIFS